MARYWLYDERCSHCQRGDHNHGHHDGEPGLDDLVELMRFKRENPGFFLVYEPAGPPEEVAL